MDDSLPLLVQELLARVTALENNGGKPQKEENGLRERLRREREDRIQQKEVERFRENSSTRGAARPTSQHRREELTRRSNNVLPAPGGVVKERKVIEVKGDEAGVVGSAPATGAFYGKYLVDGHTYLQGGSVTGGNGGSKTIPPGIDLKLIDAVSGPTHTDGTILYLKVGVTANVSAGIMLPGCEVTSATTGTGSSLPANSTLTVSSTTGFLYAEIGRWTETDFLPSGSGNFSATGCIGNFTLNR